MTTEADTLRDEIRRRYADAANTAADGQQASDGPPEACFGTALYDDLDGIPEGAGLASLGCGNPIASPTSLLVRRSSISAPGAASMFSSQRSGSDRPVRSTDWT